MCTVAVILLVLIIIGHIMIESIPAFREVGTGLFQLAGEWRPTSNPARYSLLPAILGTLYVSLLGVIFSLIIGIGCAFFMNFYLPMKLAATLNSFINLVAGIPSVIFGFIGLTVLVKWFQTNLGMTTGQCVLVAGIVLGVMLLPFVVSTCSESIAVSREKYEMTALALGISKESMIVCLILPDIKMGITASAMMAFGRGLGETMAVMMVVGNSAIYPMLLGRTQTIASLTALEMGSITYGSIHLSVLYAANLILLLILVVVQLTGWLLKRRMEKYE